MSSVGAMLYRGLTSSGSTLNNEAHSAAGVTSVNRPHIPENYTLGTDSAIQCDQGELPCQAGVLMIDLRDRAPSNRRH